MNLYTDLIFFITLIFNVRRKNLKSLRVKKNRILYIQKKLILFKIIGKYLLYLNLINYKNSWMVCLYTSDIFTLY